MWFFTSSHVAKRGVGEYASQYVAKSRSRSSEGGFTSIHPCSSWPEPLAFEEKYAGKYVKLGHCRIF